jgi:hypothetical protein
LLLRGGMNLNPRFEQLDITEGGEHFDLVERIEAELPFLPVSCRPMRLTNGSNSRRVSSSA